MPRGNKTGPAGQGPMTGRAAGYCAGFATPGYMNASPGRFAGRGGGFGRGRGFGMGRGMGYRGNWPSPPPVYTYAPPYSAKDEAEMLSQEAEHLEAHLKEIKQRIANLEETPEHKT